MVPGDLNFIFLGMNEVVTICVSSMKSLLLSSPFFLLLGGWLYIHWNLILIEVICIADISPIYGLYFYSSVTYSDEQKLLILM